MQQESASHAVANLVKRPTEKEKMMLQDSDELANTKMALVDAQEELNRLGGVEKLVQLMEMGSSRVRSAACAAVANAMTDCPDNRQAFQEANGVYQLVRMLRDGDCHAQVAFCMLLSCQYAHRHTHGHTVARLVQVHAGAAVACRHNCVPCSPFLFALVRCCV